LLFLASNFNRISSVPDDKLLLGLLIDTEPRSLDTDFASYSKETNYTFSKKKKKEDYSFNPYGINSIHMNIILIGSLSC
jgi:hypothetical protein